MAMGLKVSRILHAGYLFESQQTRIAFDTIFENPFSRNAYAFPPAQFDLHQIQNLKLDAVFISHYHDDHCSFDSLKLLNRETPIYMYCLYEEMFSLLRDLGFRHVFPLILNRPVQIGDITVIPRRALDADVDCIFQIESQGVRALNVVDSWIDEDCLGILQQQGKWDLILWPFQTMREIEVLSPTRFSAAVTELPPEWLYQIRFLNPKVIVPSSCQFQMEEWSWYNRAFFPITYQQFEKQINEILPQTEVMRLDPGQAVLLSPSGFTPAENLKWIQLLQTEQRDYIYQPALSPPPLSEIAQRFPQLSDTQKKSVLEFCHHKLPSVFKSLAQDEQSYFAQTRIWELRIYDSVGHVTKCRYRLSRAHAELITSSEELGVEWLTEVPLFKLYAALEDGESLTSMYMRINGERLADSVENQLEAADLMEDPLLRCLFEGKFASYQKAQLRKIL